MIEDDRSTGLDVHAQPAAFVVAPVRRRRGPAGLLVAAAAVALTAFVAGMVLASPGGTDSERVLAAGDREPAASPEDSPPAAAASMMPLPSDAALAVDPAVVPAAGTARPTVTAAPGSSRFLAGFEPAVVVAQVDAGRACEVGQPLEKAAPRTRVDGPRLTFQRSWLVYCRIPAGDRQAFLVDLFQALRPAIPAETYAYGTTLDGAGNALFPYADRPMAGTVAVHADAAGKGLAIVVVVEEWRTG